MREPAAFAHQRDTRRATDWGSRGDQTPDHLRVDKGLSAELTSRRRPADARPFINRPARERRIKWRWHASLERMRH